MATTVRQAGRVERLRPWQRGTVAGVVAGVPMGIAFSVLMPGLLETAIPALVGLSGVAAGWTVHLSISAVFGVGFAALVEWTPDYGNRPGASAATGVSYGLALWLVAAGVVMPLWLSAVGFSGAPAVPNLTAAGFSTHVLYGAVLGATYWLLGGDVPAGSDD